MSLRVVRREKETWQKAAKQVGEDLSNFVREAVRPRIREGQRDSDSPWDGFLGRVNTDAPSATNKNVRQAMRV
jgi:hypothetical protein